MGKLGVLVLFLLLLGVLWVVDVVTGRYILRYL